MSEGITPNEGADLENIERERAAGEGMAPTGTAPEAGDVLEKGQELAADQQREGTDEELPADSFPSDADKINE